MINNFHYSTESNLDDFGNSKISNYSKMASDVALKKNNPNHLNFH